MVYVRHLRKLTFYIVHKYSGPNFYSYFLLLNDGFGPSQPFTYWYMLVTLLTFVVILLFLLLLLFLFIVTGSWIDCSSYSSNQTSLCGKCFSVL